MDIDKAEQRLSNVVYNTIDMISCRTGVPIETKPRVCVAEQISAEDREFLNYNFNQRAVMLKLLLTLEEKFPGAEELNSKLTEARHEFDSAVKQYKETFRKLNIGVRGTCRTIDDYIAINKFHIMTESEIECELIAAHEAGHYAREKIYGDYREPHHVAEFFAEIGAIIYASERGQSIEYKFTNIKEVETYVSRGLLQEDDLKHLIVKIAIGENYAFIKNNWPDIFNMSTDEVQKQFFEPWLSDFEKKAAAKK
jgi:hypothetical protein